MMFHGIFRRLHQRGIRKGAARTVCAAIGAVLGLSIAAPAWAEVAKTVVIWKTEAIDRTEAGVALSEFYASMYNIRQLATKEVKVRPGDTPTDVMRREGSWPAYLGPSNRLLDSVICDLNRETCERSIVNATGQVLAQVSQHVAATEPSDGNWKGLQANALLRVPDYVVEMHYETIVTSAGYIAKRFDKGAPIKRTGTFAAIYCNLNLAVCPGASALTWDGAARPPILLFDPRQYVAEPGDSALPKGAMDDFMAGNARAVMIAVPILYLRQSIALPPTGNDAQIGLDDLQRSMSRHVIISRQLRMESAVALQDLNRVYLDWMTLGPPVEPPDTDTEEEAEIQPVTVYHFDQQAKLQHCLFQTLAGVQLFEWQSDDSGGGRPVPMVPTGVDCTPIQGVARRSADHGTHTLGLLVSQLEAFAQQLPDIGVPYFNVVHVPLKGFLEVEADTGDAAQIETVLSTMFRVRPRPDVVSISLSWPPGEQEIVDEQIVELEDLATFVVAAPDQEAINACARSPAGIKGFDGEFARNVISVIGLRLAGAPGQASVVLLDGAGTGSNCHEIGALGELTGPIGETNAVGQLSGSSQATPIVAATVAELIRRHPARHPLPQQIAFRLVSTGWLNPEMINRAKATLLDSRTALRTLDVMVLKTGCKVFGEYLSIRREGERDNYIYWVGNTQRFIKGKDQLMSFRNLDDERVAVVYLLGEEIRVEVGQRDDLVMSKRSIRFEIERVDASQGSCDAVDHDNLTTIATDVDQLIIGKMGD